MIIRILEQFDLLFPIVFGGALAIIATILILGLLSGIVNMTVALLSYRSNKEE